MFSAPQVLVYKICLEDVCIWLFRPLQAVSGSWQGSGCLILGPRLLLHRGAYSSLGTSLFFKKKQKRMCLISHMTYYQISVRDLLKRSTTQ